MRRSIFLLAALWLCCCSIQAQSYKAHSVLAQGSWFRMAIAESGIYKIGIGDIAALEGRDVNHIALFGGNGQMLNQDNAIARPDDLHECPLQVVDMNGNGMMDGNDYVLFYAEGPNTWTYDNATHRYLHQRHPYDNYNYVFLGLGVAATKRIETLNNSEVPDTTIAHYMARGLYERDILNTDNTGLIWVGESFSSANSSRSISVTLPHINSNAAVNCRIAMASLSKSSSEFGIALNGATKHLYLSPTNNYDVLDAQYRSSSTSLNFDINFATAQSSAMGYLDYIEVNAEAPLSFGGSQWMFGNFYGLHFNNARLQIANANSHVKIWDVSDPNNVKQMTSTLNGSTLTFITATDRAREFVAFDESAFFSPIAITALHNQDIHGNENPDLVIVTHSMFAQQAEQLATLHRIYDGMVVLVVDQQEVFNEFSSGKADPMAIREMMRMFFRRSLEDNSLTRPSHLILFGKGTFDNRDILGNNLPTVVTYQSEVGFTDESTFSCSDDPLGYLEDSEVGMVYESLDISIGRLPARNTEEANLLVDKIERYLSKHDLTMNEVRGDWRNYVALLSDDADPSCPNDTDFALSNESLSRQIADKYPWINMDKIYADAYIQQSGAIGSYYPDANNALRQRMDYGCLLLNYIGHGSDQYIGTERYIQESDMTNYNNLNQLAFFVTSTCSFGKFDRIEGNSGAEMFLLSKGAGVGVVAAARPISHVRSFNTALVMNCLNTANTVGNALRLVKNSQPLNQNVAITLLGDPALRLSVPELNVRVTKINGKEISDNRSDSCLVLSEVTVEGVIENDNGVLASDFNGIIYPIVFDRATQNKTLANDNEGTEIDFTQQKNILYKGCDSVRNGHFSYKFIVPRDVAYQFGQGKLSHYAKSTSTDASGAYCNIYFGGFNNDVEIREIRPEIRLFINDSNFIAGGITNETPSLFAILHDSVGINAVGSGMGHDITAMLDENPNDLYILNDFYQTDIADAQRGFITYTFPTLTPGYHTLTMKAWNIYNYSNSASIDFYVRNNDTLTIGRFFGYPNPSSSQTAIHLEYNAPSTIESAVVTIYNMNGQVVRIFSPTVDRDAFVLNPIVWDFSNAHGVKVQDGIYVVRALLTTSDGETKAATCKVVKK